MSRSTGDIQSLAQTDIFIGGGEMGAAVRAFNWSATPLGPVAGWPESLKTAVRIMLASRRPMSVWWGDQLINLYNDASRGMLGGKHPAALGRPAESVWQEIWDQVGPRARSAMLNKVETYDEAFLLIMERHGHPEETYYTYSFSPVPDDHGGTGGILCTNTDDTQRIVAERQFALMRTLAACDAGTRTAADACRLGGQALETDLLDLPFAAIYLVDRARHRAVLAGRSGITQGHPAAPEVLDLTSDHLWPMARFASTNTLTLVTALPGPPGSLPRGAWDRPPEQGVIVPIERIGILIAGLNPYRRFDPDYQDLLELIARQLEQVLVRAREYEARRTRAEAARHQGTHTLLAGERAVLEMVARGQPLTDILDALAHFIESKLDDALCSILLLDRDDPSAPHGHLRHGAAPTLPPAYNQAIDGIVVGSGVGSCGTAAYRGEPVIVSDITSDELWSDFRDLAAQHGLSACWSTPIRDSQSQVVGTFAIYHRRPHAPGPGERELVDVLTYLAGLAIERDRRERERSDLLDRERSARGVAEAAVRARDEFLSIASHELRTPLTVIKGTTQALQRFLRHGTLDIDRLAHQLDIVQRASNRLAVLIGDLLDVSRLQAGQLTVRPERLDLAAFLREVVDRYAEEQHGNCVLEGAEPNVRIDVDADAGRLEQILDNLLDNAVKYSPPATRVVVRVTSAEGGVTVTVRDRGIGLPAGEAERIFEPFGRAANVAARNLPGMGLGLYVSRRIAESHGGRLWATSDGEDQGTSVNLWLPMAATETPAHTCP